jgi:hypothetical protein
MNYVHECVLPDGILLILWKCLNFFFLSIFLQICTIKDSSLFIIFLCLCFRYVGSFQIMVNWVFHYLGKHLQWNRMGIGQFFFILCLLLWIIGFRIWFIFFHGLPGIILDTLIGNLGYHRSAKFFVFRFKNFFFVRFSRVYSEDVRFRLAKCKWLQKTILILSTIRQNGLLLW